MVKSNPRIIQNVAFGDRVLDLPGAQTNQKFHGWACHSGSNQQFTFVRQHGKEYKIFTTAGSGESVHISSAAAPSEGDPLAGGEASSIYTVRRFVGYYHISIDHKSGMPLFRTLTNGGMGTKITLQKASNTLNQLWCLSDVPE